MQVFVSPPRDGTQPGRALDCIAEICCLIAVFGILLAVLAQALPCNLGFKHYSWMMGDREAKGVACATVSVIALGALQLSLFLISLLAVMICESIRRAQLALSIPVVDVSGTESAKCVLLLYSTQFAFCCVVLFATHIQVCTYNADPAFRSSAQWHEVAVLFWLALVGFSYAQVVRLVETAVESHRKSPRVYQKARVALKQVQYIIYIIQPVVSVVTVSATAFSERRGHIPGYSGPLELLGFGCVVWHVFALRRLLCELEVQAQWFA
jgi:hypothetical protein